MKTHRLIAAVLSAAILTACAPAWAAAEEEATKGRLQDLDFMIESLEKTHPDFYANTTREAVAAKRDEIAAKADKLDAFGFAVELQTLTAMAGDSHTSLRFGALTSTAQLMPCTIKWMEGRWVLTSAPKAYGPYVSQTVVSIGGHTMDEVADALAPVISYDNEVKRRYSFEGLVYVGDMLQYFGVIPADAAEAQVAVRDAAGKETVLTMPLLTADELQQTERVDRRALRSAVPETEYDKKVNYKLLNLGAGTLYIQYNQCIEDEALPMAAFAETVRQAREETAPSQILIDLRNNGGGSDGVLRPVMRQMEEYVQAGGSLYVLVGQKTFSSAVINAVQLKQIGGVLAGEPTGGSVDHFGAVALIELPVSGLQIGCSTKFIDMGDYFEVAKPYGVEPLRPDMEMTQTWADDMRGIDTAVNRLVRGEAEAVPSTAKMTVNGKTAALPAYEIGGQNYVKLRSLAMALSGSEKQFSVQWDGASETISLRTGVGYTPVRGENAALPAGRVNAVRTTAAAARDGVPMMLAAYEIGDYNYVRLRDFCRAFDMAVTWDGQTGTVALDPKKGYQADEAA